MLSRRDPHRMWKRVLAHMRTRTHPGKRSQLAAVTHAELTLPEPARCLCLSLFTHTDERGFRAGGFVAFSPTSSDYFFNSHQLGPMLVLEH